MPTPFMHLQIAERVLVNDALYEEQRRQLKKNLPAFYLGNIAPDYQTIFNVAREKTHFYQLPPAMNDRAYPEFLNSFPLLKNPHELSVGHAVFIAAYCAHLFLDLQWYHGVLVPYFVSPETWDDNHQRFVVHNTLLTYLDKEAVTSLPANAAETLASAEPNRWLPFAADNKLTRWRDILVDQLRPGATLKTIEIYAQRLYLTPEEFASNLEKREWMETYLFKRVPIEAVKELLASSVLSSVQIINQYLGKGQVPDVPL